MTDEQTPAAGPNEALIDMLTEARDFIDRYSDVNDGSYGVPEPNDAMVMVHEINATLEHLPSPASSSSVVQGDAGGYSDAEIEKAAQALVDHRWNGTQPGFDCKPPSWKAEHVAEVRAVLAALRPQPSGETREASSDQPEQGGGMERYGYRVFNNGIGICRLVATPGPDDINPEPLTPAEAAEARVRSMTEERDSWRRVAERIQARATAAEAKLARAVEGLEAIRDLGSDGEHSGDRHARCRDFARQALAALQEAGADR